MTTNRTEIGGASPFFIVRDVPAALSFYRDKLGFEVAFAAPPGDPFFGIVRRDAAMLMLKDVDLEALPNSMRNAEARWDAYFHVSDPDTLAGEFTARGVAFSEPLKDSHDRLRGFEVKDPDGHVLFFGRPNP